MPQYEVTCDALKVRTGPGTGYTAVAQYYKGETLYGEPVDGESDEKSKWIKYIGAQSNEPRYVCYYDSNGQYLRLIKL